MEFAAENLPDGLALDRSNGQISGSISSTGRQLVRLRATNQLGGAGKELTIIVGEEIALTPPMGWNSWNIWGGSVTQEKSHAAAHALVATGLRDHGWTYVNIDDGWQGLRGGEFNAIQPNKKFPDMPALANEIHTLGLKFGIYSTPWRTSFHGHVGSSADFEDGSNEWTRSGSTPSFSITNSSRRNPWLDKIPWLKPLADRLVTSAAAANPEATAHLRKIFIREAGRGAVEGVGRRLFEIRLGADRCRACEGNAGELRAGRTRHRLQRGEQCSLRNRTADFHDGKFMAHIRRCKRQLVRCE